MSTFEVVTRSEQPTAVLHDVVAIKDLPQFFGRAFGQVVGAMQAQGLTPTEAPFALYLGIPGETVEVEVGFVVPKPLTPTGDVRGGTLPGGRCVHGVHVGPYERMAATYDELRQWAAARNLTLGERMWEVYLSDPRLEPDPERWRTEIFWPVA